jgi:hypothetical protein
MQEERTEVTRSPAARSFLERSNGNVGAMLNIGVKVITATRPLQPDDDSVIGAPAHDHGLIANPDETGASRASCFRMGGRLG